MKLIGLAELAELYGISKNTASSWSRRRDFPEPVADLKMGPVWSEDEIMAWRTPHERILSAIEIPEHLVIGLTRNTNCSAEHAVSIEPNEKGDPAGGRIAIYCKRFLVDIAEYQIVARGKKILIIEATEEQ